VLRSADAGAVKVSRIAIVRSIGILGVGGLEKRRTNVYCGLKSYNKTSQGSLSRFECTELRPSKKEGTRLVDLPSQSARLSI
jgi:hypothetical protein